jgi:hypothetical protein
LVVQVRYSGFLVQVYRSVFIVFFVFE